MATTPPQAPLRFRLRFFFSERVWPRLGSPLVAARRHGVGVILIAVVTALGYAFQKFESDVAGLVRLELACHTALSYLNPQRPYAGHVVVVKIDDAAFRERTPGTLPLDRTFLAKLLRKTAAAGPKVITLDVPLTSPGGRAGDVGERSEQNQDLISAIREATERHVAVVLTLRLADSADLQREQPNIIDDRDWPDGVSLGYTNLPEDRRLVPLEVLALIWTGYESHYFQSLALQTGIAWGKANGRVPVSNDGSLVEKAIINGNLLYAGFVRPDGFTSVTAGDVLDGKAEALDGVKGRIAMIGATWDENAENQGAGVDLEATPVGSLSGVFVHANYVAAMLDGRVRPPVRGSVAALIDLVLATLLIVLVTLARRTWARWAIVGLFFALLLVAGAMYARQGLYLDFLLPVVLLLIGLPAEHFLQRRRASA